MISDEISGISLFRYKLYNFSSYYCCHCFNFNMIFILHDEDFWQNYRINIRMNEMEISFFLFFSLFIHCVLSVTVFFASKNSIFDIYVKYLQHFETHKNIDSSDFVEHIAHLSCVFFTHSLTLFNQFNRNISPDCEIATVIQTIENSDRKWIENWEWSWMK